MCQCTHTHEPADHYNEATRRDVTYVREAASDAV